MQQRITRKLTTLLIALLLTAPVMAASLKVYLNREQKIDQHFATTYLPQIEEMARQYALELEIIDGAEALPAEITVTPQIVFENRLGRSFYVGRFSELSRLGNFIRTVRNNPQQQAENVKTDILTYRDGRSVTVLPIKITPLTTENGNDEASADAETKFMQLFQKGFEQFAVEASVNFSRTNRAFYLDVHPYANAAGQLFLSYEIYSQFNCVEPVLSQLSEPLVGDLSNPAAVWQKLAIKMEESVFDIISNNLAGDGFTAIPSTTTPTPWPKLNNDDNTTTTQSYTLGNDWTFGGAVDAQSPIVQFNFFAPLDNYAGEVTQMEGELHWEGRNQLSGAFEVNTRDVTMGEENYDKNVHKKYLKVFRYPKATFKFENAMIPLDDIANGTYQAYTVQGEFTMMKRTYPIDVKTSIEPFTGESGEAMLLVTASFDVNIFEKFSINGPDGPEDAKRNMHFSTRFLMEGHTRY